MATGRGSAGAGITPGCVEIRDSSPSFVGSTTEGWPSFVGSTTEGWPFGSGFRKLGGRGRNDGGSGFSCHMDGS